MLDRYPSLSRSIHANVHRCGAGVVFVSLDDRGRSRQPGDVGRDVLLVRVDQIAFRKMVDRTLIYIIDLFFSEGNIQILVLDHYRQDNE